MVDVTDYKSDTVLCTYLAHPTGEECEKMIGKTIARIEAYESLFIIYFTDGTDVEISDHVNGTISVNYD
jgi:hypothetical protein